MGLFLPLVRRELNSPSVVKPLKKYSMNSHTPVKGKWQCGPYALHCAKCQTILLDNHSENNDTKQL